MTERYVNQGVHITGDNAGAVAAGRGARANYYGSPPAERTARVEEALTTLRETVERHSAQLAEAKLMLRDITRVEEEVRHDPPDRVALGDSVGRLLQRAANVAAVVTAVQQLKGILGL